MAYLLDDTLDFPPPELADDTGLLAVGGDLSVKRLVKAYSEGIFPWYHDGLPILWHSPDPRMILPIADLHIGRSLQKQIRRAPYRIAFDTNFPLVIKRCADAVRPDQDGTWITEDMQNAYCDLFTAGFAHSAEAWDGDELVGGLYGVSLGCAFFGESMFANSPDASKIAFATLALHLKKCSFEFIDCQMETDHLARFGAAEIPRKAYLQSLKQSLKKEPSKATWEK